MSDDSMEQYRVWRLHQPLEGLVDAILTDAVVSPEQEATMRCRAKAWIKANARSYLDYMPDA